MHSTLRLMKYNLSLIDDCNRQEYSVHPNFLYNTDYLFLLLDKTGFLQLGNKVLHYTWFRLLSAYLQSLLYLHPLESNSLKYLQQHTYMAHPHQTCHNLLIHIVQESIYKMHLHYLMYYDLHYIRRFVHFVR